LTSAAEGIARGDLSQRVPISGNDEVAELSDTFNRMAAELERAELVRRNMTADIAHELRTPLTVIRGRLEGVLDGIYPATTSHLQPILEQTELLTYLVEDLRTLAQAEAGQLDLDRQAVDVGELLQEAVLAFENQSAERRIRLSLEVPDGLPRVSADGRRLAQVLGNLLTNALRHTPEGGQVTISAAAARGAVRLAVTDTGTGIPADELPHVFDRFWRGDKSRSRAGGGVGLGLAIARQFIELHGGTIGAESTPGQGASFWFTLPVT
jgi:two-component system OmpR family sensor kinase/two-component system sensor histidine kinase BaeS